MTGRLVWWVVSLWFWAGGALQAEKAETVVAALNQTSVAITTRFDGSEILVYGAVKRSAPLDAEAGRLAVIITLSGPASPVVVRRKERRFGVWVNADSIEVDAAPSFYAVASSAPLSSALRQTEDLRHKISVAQAIRHVGAPPQIADADTFTRALVRIRTARGLYQTDVAPVVIEDETLFSTSIDLPVQIVEGNYEARIFLTRAGRVIDHQSRIFHVRKEGLERFIHTLSRQSPLVYGLLSLFIAIVAGWGASAIFRWVRF